MSPRSRRQEPRRGKARVHPGARAAAAHRHTDAGTDRVVCLLCGETYRAITYLHLKRVHHFEGAHPIRDYKARFGLRVACCQETCDRAKEVQIQRHERAGRHWTRERLLRELRRGNRSQHALAHSRAPAALALAARRMFGGWDAALRAAGIDPREHRFTKTWDLDRLVAAIRGHARTGHAVSSSWVMEHDPALHRAAIRLLGNWTSAIRAAGLDVRAHRVPKRWTLDHVVEWVRRTHAESGDVRSSHAPAGALERVRGEVGVPWSAFLESLGIPYPGSVKRLDWSDAEVLRSIRARGRSGKALNAMAVERAEGQALTKQARIRFGSWGEALRRAGYDPDRILKTRVWTRADVVAALRAMAREGKSLRRAEVVASHKRLVWAAARVFPWSWRRALAAAGLTEEAVEMRGRARRRGPRKV